MRVDSFIVIVLLHVFFIFDGMANSSSPDSTIKSKKGQFTGYAKNFFMATQNSSSLYDYWANATGVHLGYVSTKWNGFSLGVSTSVVLNTFSSDLNKIDPITGRSAALEKELFDLNHPYSKGPLTRLEELYVKYQYKQSFISFGKLNINKGPLLLKRDGRMIPFVFQGVWGEFNQLKNQQINIGWIYKASSRSTMEWESLSDLIGRLNNGYQPDGTKADYSKAVQTNGLTVIGYQLKVKEGWRFQLTDYYLDKIFNIVWFQVDVKSDKWESGLQFVFQSPNNYQSKIEYQSRYIQPNEQAKVLAGKFDWKGNNDLTKLKFAALYGFGGGRFLFPKELTREDLFATLPRSRAEGFGRVAIFNIGFEQSFKKSYWSDWKLDFILQRVEAPKYDDYKNNKYGNFSYFQSLIGIDYKPKKNQKLELSVLYIARLSEKNLDVPLAKMAYKSNMNHLAVILNVSF